MVASSQQLPLHEDAPRDDRRGVRLLLLGVVMNSQTRLALLVVGLCLTLSSMFAQRNMLLGFESDDSLSLIFSDLISPASSFAETIMMNTTTAFAGNSTTTLYTNASSTEKTKSLRKDDSSKSKNPSGENDSLGASGNSNKVSSGPAQLYKKNEGNRTETISLHEGNKTTTEEFAVSPKEEVESKTSNARTLQSKGQENDTKTVDIAKTNLEMSVQNNQTLDPFSACLLIKDDNHYLIEWLSFHYHTLPLRRLILAVDPTSETSPKAIVDRWEHRMNISLWNDEHYMTAEEYQQAKRATKSSFPKSTPSVIAHRARQRLFMRKCLLQLKQEGQGWTALIDTDEYLRVNHETLKLLKNETSPPITEPGSVASLLHHAERNWADYNDTMPPCAQIPRSRYAASESKSTQIQPAVPTDLNINAKQMQTLRWRKHAKAHDYMINKISKVMMDLRRIDTKEIGPVISIHRPIRSLCTHRKLHIRSPEQFFLVHHYPGTPEQYNYRDDPRDGKERIQHEYKRMRGEVDDYIQPWLKGFVQSEGVAAAQELLKDVGVLEAKPSQLNQTRPSGTNLTAKEINTTKSVS